MDSQLLRLTLAPCMGPSLVFEAETSLPMRFEEQAPREPTVAERHGRDCGSGRQEGNGVRVVLLEHARRNRRGAGRVRGG